MRGLLLLVMLAATALAQFSGPSSDARRFRRLAADPATCTVGEVYFNTATAKTRQCYAANTWGDQLRADSAGNVAIGTTLLDAPTTIPEIPAGNVAIADGANKDVCWMSADRRTLYTCNTNTLSASADGGTTWTTVKAGFSASIKGVRDLDNGELLVSLNANAGTPGSLWLSSGYPTLGSAATWSKVLDAGAGGVGPSSFFSGTWGMSCYRNICVVAEYGLQNPPTDSARFVYLSTDYAATWTQVFDVGVAASAHIHGAAYDPWWDAIWIVNGDSAENKALRVSFDRGQSWSVVSTAMQHVGILPMENSILFTTDDAPNGVFRIPRTKERVATVPVQVYSTSEAIVQAEIGTMPFMARGPGMPALFPFLAKNGSGLIVATYDGLNFTRLWTDTATYVMKGPQALVGPTMQGTLVGWMLDDRQANPSRISMPFADAEPPQSQTQVLNCWLPSMGPNPLCTLYAPDHITVTRVNVNMTGTAPAGCSAAPVIKIGLNGSQTNVVSLANGAYTADSGLLALSYAKGAAVWVGSTAGTGCGTNPTNMNVTIQYRMSR